MSKERNGKGEHKRISKNFDKKIKDKERSSERNEYKNKLPIEILNNYNFVMKNIRQPCKHDLLST